MNANQPHRKSRFFRVLLLLSLALTVVFCTLTVIQSVRLGQAEKHESFINRENAQAAARVNKLQSEIDALTSKYDALSSQATAVHSTVSSFPTSSTSNEKVAYLTFDDGPSRYTTKLLAALNQADVKATFFVIGLNCQEYPDAVKQEAAGGHVIGIHSWTHKYSYIYANMTNFKQDFIDLRDYLTQQLGKTPTICRFPGGTNNTVSKKYTKTAIMQNALSWVESMGIRAVDWDADAGDAETPIPTAQQIVQRIMSEIGNKKQPVILMHDFGNRTSTIDAIPTVVQELRAKGYSFGTLSASTPATIFKPAVKDAS